MTHEECIIFLSEAVAKNRKDIELLQENRDNIWDKLEKQIEINEKIIKLLKE